jgi:hypothetical protein
MDLKGDWEGVKQLIYNPRSAISGQTLTRSLSGMTEKCFCFLVLAFIAVHLEFGCSSNMQKRKV